MVSSFLAWSSSSRYLCASLVLDLWASARSDRSFLNTLSASLMDVFDENTVVFEQVTLHFQVQAVIHGAVNLLRFKVFPEQPHRILILLIQVTFSGIRALAVPLLLPMPIYLPFQQAKVFFQHLSLEIDSHGLLDDQPILDQLPDLLMGVSIGDFTGVQSDLLFATVESTGGKPLLKPEHTYGYSCIGKRKVFLTF